MNHPFIDELTALCKKHGASIYPHRYNAIAVVIDDEARDYVRIDGDAATPIATGPNNLVGTLTKAMAAMDPPEEAA